MVVKKKPWPTRDRASVWPKPRTAVLGGLETEAWHAKRFSMVTMWGVRLPWRARDRGDRAALRATNRTVTLHDASYLRPLEVRGEAAALHGVLAAVLDVPADAVGRLLRLPPDGFTGFEFLSVAGREVRKAHFTELKCKFDVRAGQMRLEGKVRCA